MDFRITPVDFIPGDRSTLDVVAYLDVLIAETIALRDGALVWHGEAPVAWPRRSEFAARLKAAAVAVVAALDGPLEGRA